MHLCKIFSEKNCVLKRKWAALLFLFLLALAAPAQRMYDSHGSYMGEMRDSRIYDRHGSYAGEMRGDRYYDRHGSYLGEQRKGRCYDRRGSYLGEVRSDRVYDSHGSYLGQSKGVSASMMALVFLFHVIELN